MDDDLVDVVSNKEIIEYDIQPIAESNELFRIEQDKYLLINKLRLKELYFKWRHEFLHVKTNDLDKLSKLILLVNPNFLSAWTKRKEMFTESSATDSFNKELKFCTLILSKNFKCEQAYVHRRWLIRRHKIDKSLIESEMQLIVGSLAPKIKANYYCWTYFNWLAQFYDRECLFAYTMVDFVDVLFLNPSDYCVFHSRLNLIKLIFDWKDLRREQFEKLVFSEIKLIDEILLRFAAYSTVWHYSRYFFLLMNKLIANFENMRFFDIDNLSNELNNEFIKQVKNVFVRFNDEINLDQNKGNDVFDYLVKRQISVTNVILKLYQGKEEEFSKIQNHHSNYLKFIETFLFIKN